MYHKTAALSGLVAVTGVMAGSEGYSTSAPSMPTYPASTYEASTYETSTYEASSYATAYSSSHSAPYPVTHASYPANTTSAATSVWQYYNTTVPTTVVVPVLTTVCPEPTTLTYSGVHYTATTKSQTITITNCPCTVTTTIPTMTSSLCPPGVTPTVVVPGMPAGTTQTYAATPGTDTTVVGHPTFATSVATGSSSPETTVAVPGVSTTAATSAGATYVATSASVSAVRGTSTPSPSAIEVSGAEGGRGGLGGLGVALAAVILGAFAL